MSEKTLIGIQGGVMGWDDPWGPALCKEFMRTGEQQWFPAQDPTPSVAEQNDALVSLGADFFLWHAIPSDKAISKFLNDPPPMPVLIGNEYGNINAMWQAGTNRYDVPLPQATPNLMGMLYDEAEYLQLHHDIYANGCFDGLYQWTDPNGKDLMQIESDIAQAAATITQKYSPLPIFGEYASPVLHHSLAQGGINPCPKLLKETFSAIQLATGLGAAMQYGRKFGVCVNLWGQDVGEWFTRLWGFPAHSPTEFASALRLAYLHAPDMMFVENIDILMRFTDSGFLKTEFGEEFLRFKRDFAPQHTLPYSWRDFLPHTVIVRGDEITVNEMGNLDGSGSYGQKKPVLPAHNRSVYDAFRLVTHGSTLHNSLTYIAPQIEYPSGRFKRNDMTLAQLPLIDGVKPEDATHVHTLFVPMSSCAVFDRYAGVDAYCQPELIILCNTELSEKCKASVDRCVENGAVCICTPPVAKQFSHKGKAKGWQICETLYCTHARQAAERFVGEKDSYKMDFTTHSIVAAPIGGDPNNLDFEIIEN